MQQPLALLIKNATIFWEHEVFLECCHSNTANYIFSGFFSEEWEKITVFILVLFTIFLFCHPYVNMSDVSLNLV